MGCGESKGEEGSENEVKIAFKDTNCWQMDDFFKKARNLINDFKAIVDPLDDARDDFYNNSGFYEIIGASKYNCHSLII